MKEKLKTGKFISNERGFGFVEIENEKDDIFIPPHMTNGSMTGDTVTVKIVSNEANNHRAEGKIIEILKRATETVVGTFQKSRNFGFVVPDDRNIGTDKIIRKLHR